MPIRRRSSIQTVAIEFMHRLPADLDRSRCRLQLPANHPECGGFAATGTSHHRHDLALGDRHVDPGKDRPAIVGEVQIAYFDEGFLGHFCTGITGSVPEGEF
jgi:hypothetical protein